MKKISNINLKPEKVYIIIVMLFGVLSTFLTFPLSNGDEGYHLSASYHVFSGDDPKSMTYDSVRSMETFITVGQSENNIFDIYQFNTKKLKDVEQDSVKINIPFDKGIFLKLDIAHVPAAIGVLVGRILYPSYGVMLYCARLFSLFFFVGCMGLIIQKSTCGKWTLVMLFSIPFM